MFAPEQQVKVIDSESKLHGQIVTIIGRNPRSTAEWEVKADDGTKWFVHSCRLRELTEQQADSRRIDTEETIQAADVAERAIEALLQIVGSNGIGVRKIHGHKVNSVRQEIQSILCSIARIRNSAKEHCGAQHEPLEAFRS